MLYALLAHCVCCANCAQFVEAVLFLFFFSGPNLQTFFVLQNVNCLVVEKWATNLSSRFVQIWIEKGAVWKRNSAQKAGGAWRDLFGRTAPSRSGSFEKLWRRYFWRIFSLRFIWIVILSFGALTTTLLLRVPIFSVFFSENKYCFVSCFLQFHIFVAVWTGGLEWRPAWEHSLWGAVGISVVRIWRRRCEKAVALFASLPKGENFSCPFLFWLPTIYSLP